MIRKLFQPGPKVLEPFEAYQLWAETYDDREGNALLYAEHRAVYPMLEEAHLPGKRILDAGCGTGRYLELLREFKPRAMVGIDFSPSMLEQAKAKFRNSDVALLAAGIDALPFADDSFDFVLSTLAIDHLPNLREGVQELSRVLSAPGSMIISLFHPDGLKRGWNRTFRSVNRKRLYAVKYYGHEPSEYTLQFEQCGLEVEETVEPVVDESLKPFYDRAWRSDLYEDFKGAPILLVFRLRKRRRA
jgi:malonyl-CoA O-methyltransferase